MNLVVWRSSTWKTIGEVAIASHAREVHVRDPAQALDRIVDVGQRGAPFGDRLAASCGRRCEVRISSLLRK